MTDEEAAVALQVQEAVVFEDLDDSYFLRQRVLSRIVKLSHFGWDDLPVWEIATIVGGSRTLCASRDLHHRLTYARGMLVG